MIVSLRSESTSGTMRLRVGIDFTAADLPTALRMLRNAVADAAPIFVDPDAGTNTLRREG